MLKGLACFLGMHKWHHALPQWRFCKRCEREERLRFYSDRTQSWEYLR